MWELYRAYMTALSPWLFAYFVLLFCMAGSFTPLIPQPDKRSEYFFVIIQHPNVANGHILRRRSWYFQQYPIAVFRFKKRRGGHGLAPFLDNGSLDRFGLSAYCLFFSFASLMLLMKRTVPMTMYASISINHSISDSLPVFLCKIPTFCP